MPRGAVHPIYALKQGNVTLTQDDVLMPVLADQAVPYASSGGDWDKTLASA
jgi:hypothetical protein